MRIIIKYFTTIATILFLGSCSNDGFLHETENESRRTISLTAFMPEGEPSTRVDLNQIGKNIELTWKVNDEIQIVFVQGSNKLKQVVFVTSTSIDKKTAYFDIDIPKALTTGKYDFYGVYGGNGLSDSNPTNAILPRTPFRAITLNSDPSSVQSRKDVVLYFSYKNLSASSPQTSVAFKHLGSLFGIVINDINPTISDFLIAQNLNEIRLVGINNDDKKWAFNSIICGQIYDLESETYPNIGSASNYISFMPTEPDISGNMTLWGWYPMTGKLWPELKLEITNSMGATFITSINSKEAKATAPIIGKTYYFYLAHDNTPPPATNFYFSNSAFKLLP